MYGSFQFERSGHPIYEGVNAMAAQLKLIGSEKDAANMDRQKALEAALAQIDRAFGKGSAMKLGSREALADHVRSESVG